MRAALWIRTSSHDCVVCVFGIAVIAAMAHIFWNQARAVPRAVIGDVVVARSSLKGSQMSSKRVSSSLTFSQNHVCIFNSGTTLVRRAALIEGLSRRGYGTFISAIKPSY